MIKEYNVNKIKRKSDSFVIDIEIPLNLVSYSLGISIYTFPLWSSIINGNVYINGEIAGEIGIAAHKLFVRYAFKNYNLKRLQGNVRIFNKASARMLEKSGYKLEGI